MTPGASGRYGVLVVGAGCFSGCSAGGDFAASSAARAGEQLSRNIKAARDAQTDIERFIERFFLFRERRWAGRCPVGADYADYCL